jgi:hypothetical protein
MNDDTEHTEDDPDEALLDELRALTGRVDPTPEFVVAAAKASFTWRTIDDELAELAELTYDSALEEEPAGAVRGPDGPRMLTFEARDITIELEVTATGEQRSIVGQLVPPAAGTVEIRHPGETLTAEVDELGRFSVDGVDQGPASLRLHRRATPDAAPVATDWLAL